MSCLSPAVLAGAGDCAEHDADHSLSLTDKITAKNRGVVFQREQILGFKIVDTSRISPNNESILFSEKLLI